MAAIGLYGVISYTVVARTNEIGIRLALGAGRSKITGGIVRQALYLILAGNAAGLFLALAGAQGAASLLFGLRSNDPLTIFSAALFLTLVALVASWVPAYRASRVDPSSALRYE